jgi:hypothetical protein
MPVQFSRENLVVESTTFENHPEVYVTFSQQETEAGFVLEIEGRVNVQGGGGGRLQFTGPSGAVIQGHASLDNGAPVFFAGFDSPIGGAIGNGNHCFKIWALLLMGVNPGPVQLQAALNSQPGGASMTVGRTAIEAKKERATFD